MRLEVLVRGLSDRRRGLIGWCLGVAAYAVMIFSVYPSVRSAGELDQLMQHYPDALKAMFGGSSGMLDFGTGAGYLDAELFSLMLPLFVLVVGVATGSDTIAGEEERGQLDLLLSQPVSRRRVLLEKALVVLIEVIAVSAVVVLALLAGDPLFSLGLATGKVLESGLVLVLLGLVFGWSALAVGAATRRKAVAAGVVGGFAAAAYLVGTLWSLADWLGPFRYLSPFWWAGQAPLRDGIDPLHACLLAAVSVVALIVGLVVFERRDVAGA